MADHSSEKWWREITSALKREEKWRQRARGIVRRYRDEEEEGLSGQRFNILYSNVETVRPAIYAQTPRPDVRRRYRDPSPTGATVSEVLERALGFFIEFSDFDGAVRAAVNDMLLSGRGVVRMRYEPVLRSRKIRTAVEPRMDDDGNLAFPEKATVENGAGFIEEEIEEIVFEAVRPEYVYWEDFITGPARRWEDAPWIAFRQKLTRRQAEERFGAKAGELSYSESVYSGAKQPESDADVSDRRGGLAEIWEVWDKDTRQVIFVGRGKSGILDVIDDPLGLQDFWPVPRPLFAVTTTDSLVPVPEYTLYQELAIDLERVSARIRRLTDALKLRGIYDSTMEEVGALLEAGDNEMVPVTNFRTLDGNISQLIQYAPIREVAEVLSGLYQNREIIKQTIYEVTGISDFLRGATHASETATAQRIKGSFGTLRLQERQRAVQAFARDLLRIMAELIAEKFESRTLSAVAGIPVDGALEEILRSDVLRSFHVDIETDSTIAIDEAAEQENVTRLLSAVVQFIQGISPFVQAPGNPQGVIPMDAARDMVLAAVRKFKGVRYFENALSRIGTGAPQARQMSQINGEGLLPTGAGDSIFPNNN